MGEWSPLSGRLYSQHGSHDLKIEDFVRTPAGIAIRWSDGAEALLGMQTLRDACPCAGCTGESDLFGRRSPGIIPLKREESYELQGFRPVGHYGMQLSWGDGHDSGIYSLELLRSLSVGEDE